MTTAHSQKPLALILGGGPRIGWSVATKLAAEGYKVALGSRNPDTSRCTEADILPVSVNVSDTTSVTNAFSTVKTTLGRVPSVVVYNAAALTFPADPSDPFASISAEDMERDYRVSALGAYAALREALAGFKALVAEGDDQPKVFIATGNVTPFMAVPMALTLAAGKSALVQMLQVAVAAYGEKGFRFYFPSQVTEAGNPVPHPQINAETHGKVYWELIREQSQGDWDVRFLDDGSVVKAK